MAVEKIGRALAEYVAFAYTGGVVAQLPLAVFERVRGRSRSRIAASSVQLLWSVRNAEAPDILVTVGQHWRSSCLCSAMRVGHLAEFDAYAPFASCDVEALRAVQGRGTRPFFARTTPWVSRVDGECTSKYFTRD